MRRLLTRIRCERAMALPLALGMLAVLSVSTATMITYSSTNSRSVGYGASRDVAYQYAEAGINSAFAILNYWNDATQQNNAADGTLLGCNSAGTSCTPRTLTFAKGSAEFYGTFSIANQRWTIYSTGIVNNPAGGASIRKQITATVPVAWNNTQPANAAAWNYMYSTKANTAGSCEVSVNGNNAVINFPIYIKGDLCLTNTNARVDEDGEGQTPPPQPIDIRVGGKVVFAGSGTSIGVVTDNVTSAAIVGGCASSVSGTATACTSSAWSSKYFVDTNTSFTAIEEPTADFATYYTTASPGPSHPCTAASSPASLPASTWDNDTVQNGTNTTFNLTPTASGSSYQCKTYDVNGTQVGELSWSQSTNTLTIQGAIFIDGNVTTQSTTATYQGTASLYVGGTFTLNGNTVQLCANAGCDFATWNPNNEMLMVIANGSGNAINFGGTQNKFQGGFFCNSSATANFGGNNSKMAGPVVCGSMSFATGVTLEPLPAITQLPLGAPLNPNVHASPGKPYFG